MCWRCWLAGWPEGGDGVGWGGVCVEREPWGRRCGGREGVQRLGGDVDGDGGAGEAGVGGDAVEEALEFADVVLSTVGDEPGDLRGDIDPLFEGFARQYGQTGLLVRRLNIGD